MQTSNTRRTLFYPRIGAVLILAIIVALSGLPVNRAHAETSADKFAEAEAIMQSIDVLQNDLNQAQADYDTAMAEHDAATEAMNEAQDRIDAAIERIAELQTRLASRANSMYKNGTSSFFDVLLGASSFEEFLTSWDMITKISAQDAELVQETKEAREEAETARAEFANQKEIAAEKMSQAKALKDQIESTQSALKAEAAKITAEAMELQAQEELQAEAARQAAEAAEVKQQQISSGRGGTAGASVISGSGVFAHPCPAGSVSSTFGYRTFDNAFHKGVDFAAGEGTPYYAADSGTVMYVTSDGGYNGGAGNWIVISHGNGIVTKYMHSSAVYVSAGQQVERGQNIGAVGNTGNSFGAHLHFQVEVGGTAVDPMQFI